EIATFPDTPRLSEWATTCAPTFAYLIAVGGDSTQSAAAVAALRLGVPLVPVPNGFGNMFARALGLRASPASVIALLEAGRMLRVDVGRVGDDLFLSHKSYGALQQIEEAVEHGRTLLVRQWLRRLAYYLTAGRYLA